MKKKQHTKKKLQIISIKHVAEMDLLVIKLQKEVL